MNRNYTIVAIDDTYENLKYLSNLFKNEGYILKASTDCDFALKSFEIEKPDIILLDIKMPKKNGFEVCKILKQNTNLCDIPVIFISALDDIESKIRAFNEGGVDYITKPFEKEEVLARVNTQIDILKSKESIKNLLIQQDFFLKKIIHEMNTPLSIIGLNIDNLEKHIGKFEQFESIKAASKSLSSIYNDLYYLTKKEQRIFEQEKISVVDFIGSRINFFYEIANVKNIIFELKIDKEFDIFMDKYEFERIIDNTISNAIKYSYENQIIKISLKSENYYDKLSFENIGVTIADKINIFSPFVQQTNKSFGLGLGLFIVNEICQKNSIKINLISENEKTVFEYSFTRK